MIHSMSTKKRTKKNTDPNNKKSSFELAGTIFNGYTLKDKGGYITQEFQDYGYRLAVDLGDMKHKSLYIKMAKNENRAVLESALSFVSDANAKSPARLFMWKVKQLKEDKKQDKLNNEKK